MYVPLSLRSEFDLTRITMHDPQLMWEIRGKRSVDRTAPDSIVRS